MDILQNSKNLENNIEINTNKIQDLNCNKSIFVLDTAFFIKLKQFNFENIYYTTNFVINEIKDENARDNYNINKDFIIIKDPSKESLKLITKFAKKSNDLYNLSITDISVIALSYEILNDLNKSNDSTDEKLNNNLILRKEPLEWIIKKRTKKENNSNSKPENLTEEDGFVCVNNKNKNNKLKKNVEDILNDEDETNNEFDKLWNDFNEFVFTGDGKHTLLKENEWINNSNIDDKLSKFIKYEDILDKSKSTDNNNTNSKSKTPNIYTITDDFTMQNVMLKIGINVLSVNGLIVKRVKNFLFKCITCNEFNFDTSIMFCQNCGYPTLMKVGYSVDNNGVGTIYDKDPEVRVRGTQFDLPKPKTGKKSTVYVLCEDQLPKNNKKDFDVDKYFDKILDNYENMKDLNKIKKSNFNKNILSGNTSKNIEWGYPKKNPNISKKYYGKKQKNNK